MDKKLKEYIGGANYRPLLCYLNHRDNLSKKYKSLWDISGGGLMTYIKNKDLFDFKPIVELFE